MPTEEKLKTVQPELVRATNQMRGYSEAREGKRCVCRVPPLTNLLRTPGKISSPLFHKGIDCVRCLLRTFERNEMVNKKIRQHHHVGLRQSTPVEILECTSEASEKRLVHHSPNTWYPLSPILALNARQTTNSEAENSWNAADLKKSIYRSSIQVYCTSKKNGRKQHQGRSEKNG